MADTLTHSSFYGVLDARVVIKRISHCKSMQIFYDAQG